MVMVRRSSQIFTDKLFPVRLAAEKAMQQSLRVKLAFFFADGGLNNLIRGCIHGSANGCFATAPFTGNR
jgi:hypothetical protein